MHGDGLEQINFCMMVFRSVVDTEEGELDVCQQQVILKAHSQVVKAFQIVLSITYEFNNIKIATGKDAIGALTCALPPNTKI